MPVEVRIYSSEVIAKLDRVPRRVKVAVQSKMRDILIDLQTKILGALPGKYLDAGQFRIDSEDFYGSIIGSMEYEEKTGTYIISAKNTPYLEFETKDGALLYRKSVAHPYLKGAPVLEKALIESKPWIVEEIEDAVIEAL